jgi:lipopolysaccharide/colanic/teichoic acid biosynthesis glycosyltransferase
MYSLFFKRIIDLFFSLIALIIVSPLLLISSVIIKISSKGPIFFLQDRLGKDGKIFKIYKLRTMTNKKRDVDREIRKGDSEVTKFGNFLRRYKIDELPQLLNVLLGDMSIVGPRPCMPELINVFNDDGKFRIKVLPGLTGLAQINGNINLTWEDRWKYDRIYVENISFIMDVKIIIKTILILIVGEDKFVNKPMI